MNYSFTDQSTGRIEKKVMKKGAWISVTRKDGKKVRFKIETVWHVQFGSNDICIRLADIGWHDSLFFSLPSEEHGIKDCMDGDYWDWTIVTKEELEKLRIQLQAIVAK